MAAGNLYALTSTISNKEMAVVAYYSQIKSALSEHFPITGGGIKKGQGAGKSIHLSHVSQRYTSYLSHHSAASTGIR